MNRQRSFQGSFRSACMWVALCTAGVSFHPHAWAQEGQQEAQEEWSEDAYRYNPQEKRDPFMSPFSLVPDDPGESSEGKTPLQRFELGQLKLVGVILETDEPKALIEDNGGLGYIVTAGTLIGSNGGVIKAIEPQRIVIEEYETDVYGERHVQERELQLFIADSIQKTEAD